MGYEGESFLRLVDDLEYATERAGERMAKDGLERFKHNIEINTPVATRLLRQSYKLTPVRRSVASRASGFAQHAGVAVYVWEGSVYTEVDYAPFVERGTGLWGPRRAKYKIEPKTPGGYLAFHPYMKSNGGVVFDVGGSPRRGGLVVTRFVMHPGSPGAAMFRIGAAITEAEIDEWSFQALRLWERLIYNPGVRGRLSTVDAAVQRRMVNA